MPLVTDVLLQIEHETQIRANLAEGIISTGLHTFGSRHAEGLQIDIAGSPRAALRPIKIDRRRSSGIERELMKIRRVALVYCLLVATVGSSATALAVVPDCRVKVVWVMKRVRNTVSKATLERWKAWGIKHPTYKPPTRTNRPLYKSVWVRGAADQFDCFPEGVSMDLLTDTTNAESEVAQLNLLPELLTPIPYGRTPSSSSDSPSGSSTITAGQQDTAAGEYYPGSPVAGIGGGYPYFSYAPVLGLPGSGLPGSGAGGTPVSGLPPTGVSGTTSGTPIAPALTPEPASLLLLATGLFAMALLLARFGASSFQNSEEVRIGSGGD